MEEAGYTRSLVNRIKKIQAVVTNHFNEKGTFRTHYGKTGRKARHRRQIDQMIGSYNMDEYRKDKFCHFCDQVSMSFEKHGRQHREAGHLIIINIIYETKSLWTQVPICK